MEKTDAVKTKRVILNQERSFKMRTTWSILFVLFVGLSVLTAACSSFTADASTEVPPEKVVEDYYNWYLDYIGDRFSGEMRNPLIDKAYRDSDYLSEAFVQKVDGILASFENQPAGGYDPFLCAQDIPESITVDEAQVSGNEASANVETSFAGHSFSVDLEKVDGQWRITDVNCR
jgi:hypothetical protein